MEKSQVETKETILSFVIPRLAAQGGPAVIVSTVPCGPVAACRYRAASGRKCAVGILIRDEAYFPDLEEKSVGTMVETAGLRGLTPETLFTAELDLSNEIWKELIRSGFLNTLQGLHDNKSYRQGDSEDCKWKVDRMHHALKTFSEFHLGQNHKIAALIHQHFPLED